MVWITRNSIRLVFWTYHGKDRYLGRLGRFYFTLTTQQLGLWPFGLQAHFTSSIAGWSSSANVSHYYTMVWVFRWMEIYPYYPLSISIALSSPPNYLNRSMLFPNKQKCKFSPLLNAQVSVFDSQPHKRCFKRETETNRGEMKRIGGKYFTTTLHTHALGMCCDQICGTQMFLRKNENEFTPEGYRHSLLAREHNISHIMSLANWKNKTCIWTRKCVVSHKEWWKCQLSFQ